MQTTIVRWGNSRGVRLPKVLLEAASLADNDSVDIIAESNQIIIKKAQNKKTHIPLSERLNNWDGTTYELLPEDKEWLESPPVGDEIW
jgi:antitoxin component of MazEF toxin-antitoxin module